MSVLVMPPYIDVIANLFSANVMRKTGTTAPGAKSGLSSTMTNNATKKNLTGTRTGKTTPYRR